MTWAQTLGKQRKHSDGRRHNGGARRGAGRPISSAHRKILDEHLMQEVIVMEFRHGQMRRVKKYKIVAVLDKLFDQALKYHDVRAAHLYLDLTLGKATVSGGRPRYRRKTVIKAVAEAGIL